MNLLSNGRAGLGQAMSAQNSSTALANQMQAERAKLKIANDNANSASAGQMTGLAGSAAVTMGPKAYDALMTPSSLNTTNAAGSLGASGDSALSGSLNGSSMNMANTGTSAITGTADTTGTSSAIGSSITPAFEGGADVAATGATEAAGAGAAELGLGEAAAAAVPFAGWALAAGMLAYSLFK